MACGITADVRIFEYSGLPRIRTFPACDFNCSFHLPLVFLLQILFVLGTCLLPNRLAALPLEGTDSLNTFIAHIMSYFDVITRGYYQNRRRRYYIFIFSELSTPVLHCSHGLDSLLLQQGGKVVAFCQLLGVLPRALTFTFLMQLIPHC